MSYLKVNVRFFYLFKPIKLDWLYNLVIRVRLYGYYYHYGWLSSVSQTASTGNRIDGRTKNIRRRVCEDMEMMMINQSGRNKEKLRGKLRKQKRLPDGKGQQRQRRKRLCRIKLKKHKMKLHRRKSSIKGEICIACSWKCVRVLWL